MAAELACAGPARVGAEAGAAGRAGERVCRTSSPGGRWQARSKGRDRRLGCRSRQSGRSRAGRSRSVRYNRVSVAGGGNRAAGEARAGRLPASPQPAQRRQSASLPDRLRGLAPARPRRRKPRRNRVASRRKHPRLRDGERFLRARLLPSPDRARRMWAQAQSGPDGGRARTSSTPPARQSERRRSRSRTPAPCRGTVARLGASATNEPLAPRETPLCRVAPAAGPGVCAGSGAKAAGTGSTKAEVSRRASATVSTGIAGPAGLMRQRPSVRQ